jgi:DnaJ-class molecular chaperone
VQVPSKLTRQERELLERFAEIHKASPREQLEDHVRESAKAS